MSSNKNKLQKICKRIMEVNEECQIISSLLNSLKMKIKTVKKFLHNDTPHAKQIILKADSHQEISQKDKEFISNYNSRIKQLERSGVFGKKLIKDLYELELFQQKLIDHLMDIDGNAIRNAHNNGEYTFTDVKTYCAGIISEPDFTVLLKS